MGFVVYLVSKNEWIVVKDSVFLPRDSPCYPLHHRNLRQLASAQDLALPPSLHYSGLFSTDRETIGKAKEALIEVISTNRNQVRDSQSHRLCVMNVDLFELNG